MMKEKLRAFFSGRNGMDDLGKTILWAALAVLILSSLLGLSFLYGVALALLCYGYVRAFSRNLERCRQQNARYLSWRKLQALRFQQRKSHKFYRCPKCKQHLRVPKGKGKICITCRNCGALFARKT